MRQKHPKDGGKPWCIQPELVEGCSMRYGSGQGGLCHFCGLQAIRKGPGSYKFMTLETANRIASEVARFCPGVRIEYAMRGEPLMHPKRLEIFKLFRGLLPKTQMMVTTNGDTIRGKMQEQVESLFAAGLDYILLDTYYPKSRRDELREEAFALKGVTVVDFYDDWASKGLSPYGNHRRKVQRTIVLMDDLAVRDGEHSSRQVKTHAGSNPQTVTIMQQTKFPMSKSCGRPFREITIAYNGDVTLCCDDWRHQYVVANINELEIDKIWKHKRFEAARARLYNKDRAFGPCAKCDAPGAPRFGLLPVYEQPTEQELRLTANITKKGNLVLPVWEK